MRIRFLLLNMYPVGGTARTVVDGERLCADPVRVRRP